MQPYFFPYVGYFQLLCAVDRFVFLDDVNYNPRGWINRNRVLVGGREAYLTVPVADASQHRKIDQIEIAEDPRWLARMEKTLAQSYAKAPQFEPAYALVHEVLHAGERSLADLARRSVLAVARYLGIETEIVGSSSVYGNAQLAGQERILDICRREGAGTYLNLPGGRLLYNGEAFAASGVALRFIEPALTEYRQSTPDFHPRLSMIDVLMHNEIAAVRAMLAGAAVAA
jgi:hypothetical protein